MFNQVKSEVKSVAQFDNQGNLINNPTVKPEQKRKNVEYTIDQNEVLTIKIDLKKINKLGEDDISSSGKTYLLATTGGNLPLSGKYSNVKIGVNAMCNKEYIDGLRESKRVQDMFAEERKAVQAKDAKIATLEAEMAELKAMIALMTKGK